MPPRAVAHPGLRRLGQRVRELRLAKEWTQEGLAGECGLDRSYISGLELGRRNPTYLNLLRIARSFNLSVIGLLEDVERR